jgi:hypothetical protein
VASRLLPAPASSQSPRHGSSSTSQRGRAASFFAGRAQEVTATTDLCGGWCSELLMRLLRSKFAIVPQSRSNPRQPHLANSLSSTLDPSPLCAVHQDAGNRPSSDRLSSTRRYNLPRGRTSSRLLCFFPARAGGGRWPGGVVDW